MPALTNQTLYDQTTIDSNHPDIAYFLLFFGLFLCCFLTACRLGLPQDCCRTRKRNPEMTPLLEQLKRTGDTQNATAVSIVEAEMTTARDTRQSLKRATL